jgi:Histidine kinase-, DNA gyrase B-, and HSP90-like ATPase
MDKRILARAAEPFFSTKGAGKGTGLGLSMAKGFAKQSKGKFTIVSSVGAGTTVSFWLPAGETSRPKDFAPTHPEMPECNSNFRVRVLVVDDNAQARQLVSEWLVASGFQVHCADSGEQALLTVRAGWGSTSCLPICRCGAWTAFG